MNHWQAAKNGGRHNTDFNIAATKSGQDMSIDQDNSAKIEILTSENSKLKQTINLLEEKLSLNKSLQS